MTDRIGELLAELAAEDEDEEREDVPALKRGAVVSGGLRSERSESGEVPEGRTAFAQSESLGRTANRHSVTTGKIVRGRPGLIAGETAEGAQISGEIWREGPVWTVRGAGPEIDRAQRMATAERTAQAEEIFQPPRDGGSVWTGLEQTARDCAADPGLERVRRSGTAQAGLEQTGLKGLYRQTVRGLRLAAPALSSEQAGRTARAQEPGSAASLAVDELDRAVRRDSRRYDGGMSIY